MLVIKIELWPFGIESRKKQIGTVHIWNDASGSATIGNYKWKLMNFDGSRVWKTGVLTGFQRITRGPYDLLYRVLKLAVGRRNDALPTVKRAEI